MYRRGACWEKLWKERKKIGFAYFLCVVDLNILNTLFSTSFPHALAFTQTHTTLRGDAAVSHSPPTFSAFCQKSASPNPTVLLLLLLLLLLLSFFYSLWSMVGMRSRMYV